MNSGLPLCRYVFEPSWSSVLLDYSPVIIVSPQEKRKRSIGRTKYIGSLTNPIFPISWDIVHKRRDSSCDLVPRKGKLVGWIVAHLAGPRRSDHLLFPDTITSSITSTIEDIRHTSTALHKDSATIRSFPHFCDFETRYPR